jgi:hypothetical protein
MGLSVYLERLEASGENLMVFRDGCVVFSSSGKGVSPLIEVIDLHGRDGLRGVITADKIVGKAAALLNVYMGAVEVHAMVISESAEAILSKNGVCFTFREETDVVKAKDGVVFCPFEKLVWDVSDPEEAHRLIRAKLKEL